MPWKTQPTLRRGWTTGACATAAARAAYEALLTQRFPDPVSIRLPGGATPSFALALKERAGDCARAGIVKDAGDDPDVTHGALIVAEVTIPAAQEGIRFHAGVGVGTVTRPGLPLAVGEPAINPAPRAMITAALNDVAAQHGLAQASASVTISIPDGEALAKKTLNGRLGIVGGLSILGTTGIVIPYSCSSWIHAIHRGIDVARAAGLTHIAGSTGSTSEKAVQKLYALPDIALIDMGDFVGGMLKYLRRHPVERLTIAGGIGKLSKLAAGHLDLHSSKSTVEAGAMIGMLASIGAPTEIARVAGEPASAAEILARLDAVAADKRAAFVSLVARRSREAVLATLAGDTIVDVAIFDRQGQLLGQASA